MAEKRTCNLCGEPLESVHDLATCEKTELLKGRMEIKRLKASINSWKNAWFQTREIIANLWWHHPAISNDDERNYYQKAQDNEKSRLSKKTT